MAARATVEVVYARPERQLVVSLVVDEGARVRDVIARSGVLDEFPEIDLAAMRVGVFGSPRGLDDPVRGGERIEIYRPLVEDPKEMRRRRARGKR